MNKTKIEWCDYTINPIKGLCPMACSYCYARKMYSNPYYAALYNHRELQFQPAVFNDMAKMKAGSRCFVGSTMELFGDWVKEDWMRLILSNCSLNPKVTFIFLTKQPQNLMKWDFPSNCWVGVSVCNQEMANQSIPLLMNIETSKRFVSIEPMLDAIDLTKIEFGRYLPENTPYYVNALEDRYIFGDEEGDVELRKIDWLIIGSQTQPVRHPGREWVDEIITAADKAKIPIFVKEPLASYYNIQRQEFPDHLPGRY